MSNTIVQMVVALLVLGVILYFAMPYLPTIIFQLIIAVVLIGGLVWVLRLIGFLGGPPPA